MYFWVMVSVIIPYNKDRGFLQHAIKSVKAQTYENWELIVQHGKGTLGENVNKALQKADGKFIKILAEDDLLTPDCLKILTDGIQGYDFVYSDAENFGELPPGWDSRSHDKTVSLDGMLRGNGIHGGTTLYRSSILQNVGGYDESLWTGEEYDLHLSLLKAGCKHRHVPGIVYKYRIHGDNKSRTANVKIRHEYIEEIRKRYA